MFVINSSALYVFCTVNCDKFCNENQQNAHFFFKLMF